MRGQAAALGKMGAGGKTRVVAICRGSWCWSGQEWGTVGSSIGVGDRVRVGQLNSMYHRIISVSIAVLALSVV